LLEETEDSNMVQYGQITTVMLLVESFDISDTRQVNNLKLINNSVFTRVYIFYRMCLLVIYSN